MKIEDVEGLLLGIEFCSICPFAFSVDDVPVVLDELFQKVGEVFSSLK